MMTRKTKELKETKGLLLLKKDEMLSIRGGDNYDGGTGDDETKDQVFE